MGLLRLLLAISVLTTHAHTKSIFGFKLVHGDVAVQCFFMISGFYMALVLQEKYNRAGDYWIFLRQRFLRIYPTYLIVIGLYLAAFGLSSWLLGQPQGFLADWVKQGGILSLPQKLLLTFINLSLVGIDYCPFLAVDPASSQVIFQFHSPTGVVHWDRFLVLQPAWSLGAELTFYVLAPFLVRQSLLFQAAVIGLDLGARWACSIFWHLPNDDFLLIRFFPLQLGFFLAGSIGYLIYKNFQPLLTRVSVSHRWLFALFFLFLIAYSKLPHSRDLSWILFPWVFVMIPLLFTACKNNLVDRLIGELSFPFYLGHILIIELVNEFSKMAWPKMVYGPAYLLLTLAFSYLFYRFVEARTETLRARLFVRTRLEEGISVPELALPVVPKKS